MLLDFHNLYIKYNLKIKGVIQIGAHHGQETHLYKSKNINNLIYFEPIKKNFEVLKNNSPKNVILYNIALGNENKKIDMFVESNNKGMSSSILKPKIHLTQYPHIIFNEKEEVEMKRLDDIDFNRELFNLINIDVQGYEMEVFKGAEKTLQHIDYILTEINRDEVYENCTQINELKSFLSKYDFALVEENWAGNTWGDGLFIKKNK